VTEQSDNAVVSNVEDMRLSVVVPVRNERDNLLLMVPILRTIVKVPHEVVIVYDKPDDNSVEAVEELQQRLPDIRGVLNEKGVGVINAIRAGVEASRGEYVLTFCTDEFVPLLSVVSMLGLMDDGCEFVSATRYAMGGRRHGGSLLGGFISCWGNLAFRVLAGSVLSDCTTGVKMLRRDVFDKLELESNPVGWAVAFEMAIKAQYHGLKLGEVAIVAVDRLVAGESTFSFRRWIGEYLRWFKWGMKHRGTMRKNTQVKRVTYDDVRRQHIAVEVR